MLEDLNKPQKIFMILLYILTAIATVSSVFVIYTLATVKKPWTLGVTYASTLNTVEGQKDIITVSVHDNDNNNGQAVYDMRINSYTDVDGKSVAGFGIQCVGNWKIINNSGYEKYAYSTNFVQAKSLIESYQKEYGNAFISGQTMAFGDFYFYYTGDDGKVYSKTSIEDLPNYLLIDIEGSYYRLELKSYTCEVLNDDVWAWLPWVDDTKEISTKFSWFELFDTVLTSALNTNVEEEYKEFPLSLMDLSDFVTLQYKDDKGQYKDLENTTENRSYFTIQVDYSNNGAVKSSDSMFGMIYASSKWDYYADTTVNDYWNAYSELILTEDNINFVYNKEFNSYYVTIDSELTKYLETLTNSEIKVDLDLTNSSIDIYGIDLQNFTFDMVNFEIKVDSVEDFKLYNTEMCSLEPTLSGV